MRKNSLYTTQMAEAICEWLEQGGSLNAFCKQPGTPSCGAVLRWAELDIEGFREKYAQARARGLDVHADAIVQIADEAVDTDSAAVARVRIDARKWVLAKLKPKIYGDKLELGGSVGVSNLAELVDAGRKRARGEDE